MSVVHTFLNHSTTDHHEDTETVTITITDGSSPTQVASSTPSKLSRCYSFESEKVILESNTQKEVYDQSAANIVESVVQGYNASIIACGETQSGKSFTMTGDTAEPNGTDMGIIFRAGEHIFNRLVEAGTETSHLKYEVHVSYIMMYLEKVYDMFNVDGIFLTQVKLKESQPVGVHAAEAIRKVVNNPTEFDREVLTGQMNLLRHITSMSARSSRVCTVLSVDVHCVNTSVGMETTSRLNLVDLAGCKKEDASQQLREASRISKSLCSLGNVIVAAASAEKKKFIPYRDSPITWYLRQSLGGTARAVMIAHIASDTPSAFKESTSTLRLSSCARKVVNYPRPSSAKIAVGSPLSHDAAGNSVQNIQRFDSGKSGPEESCGDDIKEKS